MIVRMARFLRILRLLLFFVQCANAGKKLADCFRQDSRQPDAMSHFIYPLDISLNFPKNAKEQS